MFPKKSEKKFNQNKRKPMNKGYFSTNLNVGYVFNLQLYIKEKK
jgi:hypothetical protein